MPDMRTWTKHTVKWKTSSDDFEATVSFKKKGTKTPVSLPAKNPLPTAEAGQYELRVDDAQNRTHRVELEAAAGDAVPATFTKSGKRRVSVSYQVDE